MINRLKENQLLRWVEETEKLNPDKETINTITKKEFNGIIFKFYRDKVEVLFRPHYYFNNNLHNTNDFTVVQCISVLNEFKSVFKIDIDKANIVNIEFGINVISPIPIKDLINSIKYQLKTEFVIHKGLKYSKVASSANSKGVCNRYKENKAYAKGLQFPNYADENLFRYEISSHESKYIKRHLNVTTISDLLKVKPYLKMQEIILKEFEDVLILDPFSRPKLNNREKKLLTKLLNPDTWYHLLNHSNRNKFARARKRYYDLINRGDNNVKSQLRKIILGKIKTLKSGADSNVDIIGNCINNIEFNKKNYGFIRLDTSTQTEESSLII